VPADVPTVRVPATSANLGPGFDSMGLALDIWDEVTAAPVERWPSTVQVSGVGAATVPRDESNLILQTMRTACVEFGFDPRPVRLVCRNRIPHARGLGSSAAAICAGLLLAREIAAVSVDDLSLLDLASRIEGHPDNVAACLFGGLTIAWTKLAGIGVVRLDASGFTPVVFVPPTESSTEQARALLPAAVPHENATFNAARAALLVTALTGDPAHLLDATEDRLHQPYRASAMPESAGLVRRLRAGGVPAVISGAGPSVLALCRDADETRRAHVLAPDGWQVVPTSVVGAGASRL
jgi:homoserine kinase